jgi:hypothetical protein
MKQTILDEVVFILFFILYNITCRHTIVFYGKDNKYRAFQTSKLHLSACNCNIWTFSVVFFKNFNTSAVVHQKHFNSICVLLILIIFCFQQNRYVFNVIVTSWTWFVYCISWNFDYISTVFEEIKHFCSRAPEKYFSRLLKLIKHKYC